MCSACQVSFLFFALLGYHVLHIFDQTLLLSLHPICALLFMSDLIVFIQLFGLIVSGRIIALSFLIDLVTSIQFNIGNNSTGFGFPVASHLHHDAHVTFPSR